MALIKCRECGEEVSSKAEACPKCGAKVASKNKGCGMVMGVVILGLIIVSAISSILSNNKTANSSPQSTNLIATSNQKNTPQSKPVIAGSQWVYLNENDSMAKGSINQAYVTSLNTVNFEFPYSGEQNATLILRTHPRHGKNIIFNIEKGQILCPSYENCTILVRFDDEAPMNFSAIGPADHSTESAFFRNYDRLFEKIKKAKKVRVSANIYQQGAPVFEFDVSGFDSEKYAFKK